MLVSQYNQILVVISFIVAILAAYTALNMAARVAGSQGVAARVWLAGGGVSMGIGVWAMHFIGMLAMDLSMSMSYNAALTVLSMVIAISSSMFALWLVSGEQLRLRRLLPGAVVMERALLPCTTPVWLPWRSHRVLSGIKRGWLSLWSLPLPLHWPLFG